MIQATNEEWEKVTSATEWLLIGGPANGKKVTILCVSTVLILAPEGMIEYRGSRFVHRGELFQIGLFDSATTDESSIGRMIDESGLRPFRAPHSGGLVER